MGPGAAATDGTVGGRTVVLGFLWLGWVLLPPGLLVWGELMTWSLYGQPVPPELEREAFRWVVTAVGLAVALPLLGLCLSATARRRGSAVAFSLALVAGLLAGGLVLESHGVLRLDRGAPVDRGPVVCQEHSGGDNRCPGG